MVQEGAPGHLRRLGDRPLLGRLHGEGERMTRTRLPLSRVLCAAAGSGARVARAARGAPGELERAMFGNTFVRNMVSDEKGLPADWDVKTGKNVKWWADVGSQAYAGPVVLGGQVFVGTNNDGLRNPKLDQGPRRGHGLRRGQRRLPVADDPREAARGPRQRLAAAGHLLDARTSRATASTTPPTARPSSASTPRASATARTTAVDGREGRRARSTATWCGNTT